MDAPFSPRQTPNSATDKTLRFETPAEQAAFEAATAELGVAGDRATAQEIASLSPEERKYLTEHSLKKPLGVRHIWALGVGAVITGEYFGWNMGLKEGGPWACWWLRYSCVPCTWPGYCRWRN